MNVWFNHIDRSVDIVRQCWPSGAYSSRPSVRLTRLSILFAYRSAGFRSSNPRSAASSARVDRNTELTFTLAQEGSLGHAFYSGRCASTFTNRVTRLVVLRQWRVDFWSREQRPRQSAPFVGASRGEFYTALLAVSKISCRAYPMCARSHSKTRVTRPDRVLYGRPKDNGPPLTASPSSETRFASGIRRSRSGRVATESPNPCPISFRLKWLCRRDLKFSVMVGVDGAGDGRSFALVGGPARQRKKRKTKVPIRPLNSNRESLASSTRGLNWRSTWLIRLFTPITHLESTASRFVF